MGLVIILGHMVPPSMGETNSSGTATSVDKNHNPHFSPSSRAMGRNPDPVMNLVRNLMNIMTEFASSYKPTSGIPVPSVTNSVEETEASQPSDYGQSKKPRLHSPEQQISVMSTDPLDNQSNLPYCTMARRDTRRS